MEDEQEKEKTSPASKEFKLEWGSSSTPLQLDGRNVFPFSSGFGTVYSLPDGERDTREAISGPILPSHSKLKAQVYTKKSPTGYDYLLQRRLREAVSISDINCIQRLISSGVNPCSADSKQRTPLHFAATQGNEHVVKVLLENGANPNARDVNGNTPLHLAACTNKVQIVTLLLKAGSDLNAVDYTGRTPLEVARSTLRVLHEDVVIRTAPLRYRQEVLQIIDMLKEYMNRTNKEGEKLKLDELCSQLNKTTTIEEVDQIHELLTSFTLLDLSNSDT